MHSPRKEEVSNKKNFEHLYLATYRIALRYKTDLFHPLSIDWFEYEEYQIQYTQKNYELFEQNTEEETEVLCLVIEMRQTRQTLGPKERITTEITSSNVFLFIDLWEFNKVFGLEWTLIFFFLLLLEVHKYKFVLMQMDGDDIS